MMESNQVHNVWSKNDYNRAILSARDEGFVIQENNKEGTADWYDIPEDYTLFFEMCNYRLKPGQDIRGLREWKRNCLKAYGYVEPTPDPMVDKFIEELMKAPINQGGILDVGMKDPVKLLLMQAPVRKINKVKFGHKLYPDTKEQIPFHIGVDLAKEGGDMSAISVVRKEMRILDSYPVPTAAEIRGELMSAYQPRIMNNDEVFKMEGPSTCRQEKVPAFSFSQTTTGKIKGSMVTSSTAGAPVGRLVQTAMTVEEDDGTYSIEYKDYEVLRGGKIVGLTLKQAEHLLIQTHLGRNLFKEGETVLSYGETLSRINAVKEAKQAKQRNAENAVYAITRAPEVKAPMHWSQKTWPIPGEKNASTHYAAFNATHKLNEEDKGK